MFISGKAQECPNENKNSLWFNYPGCLYFGVFSLSLLSLSLCYWYAFICCYCCTSYMLPLYKWKEWTSLWYFTAISWETVINTQFLTCTMWIVPLLLDEHNHRWKHWLNNISLKLILLTGNLAFGMVMRLKFDDTCKLIWQRVGQQ